MEMLQTIVFVLNILSALAVVVLVLMQHGKGADMGAAFGSGTSGSLFGASGSASFLSRATAVCATVFFTTCFALAVIVSPKPLVEPIEMLDGQPAAVKINSADAQKNSKIPD